MASTVKRSTPSDAWYFDRRALKQLGVASRARYRDATPYPHAVFDDFLGSALAAELATAFPGPEHPAWMRRDYREQSARLGQLQRTGFDGVDPALRRLLSELGSMAFLDFLGALSGIDGLIADPHFRAAGPSLTLPGGHLGLHVDFNRDRTRHLERKLTVIYYLGADWKPAWGGALELWNADCSRRDAIYLPVLDRLLVMAQGERHWHGHPAPLSCPANRYRASVSAYYYVAAASSAEEDSHGAIWAEH